MSTCSYVNKVDFITTSALLHTSLSQTGEQALKSIVKDHTQQTQRRVNVFASQCADREFESSVYGHAYNDIKHLFGKNYFKATISNHDASVLRGCHTVTFMPCDSQGRGSVTVNGLDTSRKKLNIAIRYIQICIEGICMQSQIL